MHYLSNSSICVYYRPQRCIIFLLNNFWIDKSCRIAWIYKLVGRECDKKTWEVTLLEISTAFCMKVVESICNDPKSGSPQFLMRRPWKSTNAKIELKGLIWSFVLWEIMQKVFFLAWGFHIVAAQCTQVFWPNFSEMLEKTEVFEKWFQPFLS